MVSPSFVQPNGNSTVIAQTQIPLSTTLNFYISEASSSNNTRVPSALGLTFILISVSIALCLISVKILQQWKASSSVDKDHVEKDDVSIPDPQKTISIEIAGDVFDALEKIQSTYPGKERRASNIEAICSSLSEERAPNMGDESENVFETIKKSSG